MFLNVVPACETNAYLEKTQFPILKRQAIQEQVLPEIEHPYRPFREQESKLSLKLSLEVVPHEHGKRHRQSNPR
jgi:hypothetical protein